MKKAFREQNVEAILQRLDRLNQAEAQTTAAQILEVVHVLVQGMRVVMDGEQTTRLVIRRLLSALSSRWYRIC